MLVQIDELFINTDNIVALNPYEVNDPNTNYELGLVINGIKYAVYVVSRDLLTEEKQADLKSRLVKVINVIVNAITTHPVHNLKIGD